MRLLGFEIHNTNLFGKNLHIDLVATDKVSQLITDNDNIERAYRIDSGASIYSQNLIAFTGLNATGKTTILEVIQILLQIVANDARLNDPHIKPIIQKIIGSVDGTNEKPIVFVMWFEIDKQILELTSSIIKRYTLDEEYDFVYKNEILKVRSFSKLTKKNLFNFVHSKVINQRTDFEDAKFLLDDMSIASMFKDKATKVLCSFEKYNTVRNIRPMIPDVSIIQCFDSAISCIEQSDSKDKYKLKFKKDGDSEYDVSYDDLESILSSGTVKALHFFPALQSVLKSGGYILFDEIENHINKRLVEWILSLFENRDYNPHGACLIFTTHYPELLDTFVRKDNIYITRKRSDGTLEAVKYSDEIERNELLKSNVILGNLIKGTVPKYASMKAAEQALADNIKIR